LPGEDLEHATLVERRPLAGAHPASLAFSVSAATDITWRPGS
jgi:hypothetical protein